MHLKAARPAQIKKVVVANGRERRGTDEILDLVADLLEARGYDGWTLQEVAELGHCSLTTIYRDFPSRDDLIVAAVEKWMDEHVYQTIQQQPRDVPLFDALVAQFRAIYRPWEQHPEMLQVFIRAIATTNGHSRLRAQGEAAVEPIFRRSVDLDPEWARDLGMIIENVVRGAETLYVNGDIPITQILKNVERALLRLSQVVPETAPTRNSSHKPVRARTSPRNKSTGSR